MSDKKELLRQIRRLQHEADTARAELHAVHASLSWRMTRPLRAIKKLLTGTARSGPDTSEPFPDRLPPAAGRILKDLKRAVKNKGKKSE